MNACHTEGRRAKRRMAIGSLMAEPVAPEAFGAVLDRDQLERGFRRLPFEQRAVLVLRLYVGPDTAYAIASITKTFMAALRARTGPDLCARPRRRRCTGMERPRLRVQVTRSDRAGLPS